MLHRSIGVFLLLAAAVMPAVPAHAAVVFVTNWTKNANIANELNQQFPNTGFTSGGSTTGVPNATFLYDPATYTSPNAISGFPLVSNGIDFQLAADSAGHDYTEACPLNANCGPINVTVNQSSVDNVYLLMSAYFGQNFSIQFNGTGGASQSFTGQFVPDFCNGANVNSSGAGVAEFTVFRVQDVGGCGSGNSTTGANANYDLVEFAFTLSNAFQGQTLTSFSITPAGNNILLMGTTVHTTDVGGAAPEPATWTLMLAGIGLATAGIRRRSKLK